MAVQLKIPYETLRELVKQLNDEQKRDLAKFVSNLTGEHTLTSDERKAFYHSSISSIPVNEEPSIHREDWYDDDGR